MLPVRERSRRLRILILVFSFVPAQQKDLGYPIMSVSRRQARVFPVTIHPGMVP